MPDNPGRHAGSALSLMRLGWSLMLAAGLACAGLGWLASPAAPPATATGRPLTLALAGLGVLCALATLRLDRAILAPERIAARVRIPDRALIERYMLAGDLALWSLAVLPALLGFALVLLDGPLRTHLALCAVSLVVLARLMPTRRRIAARLAAVLTSLPPAFGRGGIGGGANVS